MSGDAEQGTKKSFKRLPTSVVPSNYRITLQPNLQDFKFQGNQIVELEVENHSNIAQILLLLMLVLIAPH